MSFPIERPRRLRRTDTLRQAVRETWLRPSDLIWPLFVVSGKNVRREISSMPGVFQLSVDQLLVDVKNAWNVGVRSVILFGIPAFKDQLGTSAWDDQGPVQNAIFALKNALPDLLVITDVCMCEYTEHGHCGSLQLRADGVIDIHNDETLELLSREALSHAKAGADIVAPSDMMDGRVHAIRKRLDQEGLIDVGILSYAVKYASAFYGPFREAAQSAPQSGPKDRQTYQMDPANRREAVREAMLDVEEGADMIMVKPALPYLDIIRDIRDKINLPIAAYQVSGEYAMIKLADKAGVLDGTRAMLETLTSIKRSGADLILSYFAFEAAKELQR